MHNNRSHRVSYFRSASYRSVALSSTSLLLAMFSARRPTYHHVFIDGLFFSIPTNYASNLYLRNAVHLSCAICTAWKNGGYDHRWNYSRGCNYAELRRKMYTLIIKSYFPNAIRISTDRGISIQGRNWFSLIAVAVTHPRFLDVFHLKKNLYMYASLPPPVFSRCGEFFFFPSIFNRANDLIGASRLSIEPTCLLSFMQIATAAIIDNNCRRSIAVSIASSDRIRPFASNKMHDFLSVFERLLTNPRIISRFFDVLFIIYEGTAGDSLSFFSQKFFFTSRY